VRSRLGNRRRLVILPALNSKRVTLRDVAERVGVSHVTISLALRNHPSIPLKRRREIKRMAEAMGYRPDPLLSSLAAYRHGQRPAGIRSSLAWINHWDQPERLRQQHKEFDGYWRGASAAAERFGYRLEEIRWAEDCSARRFQQILLTRNVRGLLIPPHQSPPEWGEFDWSKFPVIRFGLSVRTPDSHLVTADHLRAVVMAFERISRYGYRRAGLVVCGDFDRRLGGNYTGGFYAAQKLFKFQHALPPLMTDERRYREQPAKARETLRQWLLKHQPDAILTSVPQVPGMIRELGYRIPEDAAVAGTSIYDVPVDAGINQNPEAIGRIAVEMLVAQINVNERGEPAAPCRILVESLWQDGKSLPPSEFGNV
jgi:DNA-binding LacI/PurR family transcriptional regulator